VKHGIGTAVPFIHFGYDFDAAGNVSSESTVHPLPLTIPDQSASATYGDANEIKTLSTVLFTHDNKGNILTGKLSSSAADILSWDFENRLIGSSVGGVATTNDYDGLGNRLQMTKGGTTTRFVVDGTGPLAQIMAETDASGTVSAYYLYFGGLAARILPDGTVSYYHADRGGNVAAMTDGSGAVTDTYRYDPFGVTVSSSGSSTNPFRYLGGHGVYDGGDGTLYARARFYHPGLGRFLSRDPLSGSASDGQSLNRYAYALNSPLSLIDASGLKPTSPSFYMSYAGWMSDFATGFDLGMYNGVKSGIEGTASFIAASLMGRGQEFVSTAFNGTVDRLSDWMVAGYPVDLSGRNVGGIVGGVVITLPFALEARAAGVAAETVEARGGTYLLRDAEGNVARTGRTNDLLRREAEHARDPALKDLDFEPVHRTDVYNEQRGLEQLLHDTYNPPLNKVRPISPNNPNLQKYLDAANGYFNNP
jgi:RHS repeat-associated protein